MFVPHAIQRKKLIDGYMNGPKKPLREWVQEWSLTTPERKWSVTIPDQMYEKIYYPDDKPVTEWMAWMAINNWTGRKTQPDPTDVLAPVSLVVKAKVQVTAPMRQALCEQYKWSEEDMWNDEKVASALLYAYLNPVLPANSIGDDTHWDGVGNLNGIIIEIEAEEDN